MKPNLSLPQGGGSIKGIGETFNSNSFSGTASFSIPIFTSPCRDFEPKLSLNYESGNGNGPFGLGFTINLPSISRRTRLGIPKYDDSDVFILTGEGDLVPRLIQQPDDSWQKDSYNDPLNEYFITRFRPRTEGLFTKIELWRRKENGDLHWQLTSKENVVSILGKNPNYRIVDPEQANKIFTWLLEEQRDAKGNRIVYEYKIEDEINIPGHIEESNRQQRAQRYLHKIKYGNYTPFNTEANEWHFEVLFDYGERNWDEPAYASTNSWQVRKDPFSSFQAGFEIRTQRLCRGIFLFHRFEHIQPEPFLVRAFRFGYEESGVMSLLNSIQEIGYRRYSGEQFNRKESLPPLELKYSHPDATFLNIIDAEIFSANLVQGIIAQKFWREFIFRGIDLDKDAVLLQIDEQTWQLKDDNSLYQLKETEDYIEIYEPARAPHFQVLNLEDQPGIPGLINQSEFQIIDLHGEGLPGILHTKDETLLYWNPRGEGKFEPPAPLHQFPLIHHGEGRELEFLDLERNGKLDLIINAAEFSGYYSIKEDGSWENFKAFSEYPNNYSGSNQELVDVTGDGNTDLLFFEADGIKYYESKGKTGFASAKHLLDMEGMEYTPNRSREEAFHFINIFGDGGNHLVRIRNGEIACWPNLGYGRFGKKILLRNAPRIPGKLDPNRLFFADIDGSGTTDLIYVQQDHLLIYYNQSGNGFSEAIQIALPCSYNSMDQIQFADILGIGTTCLIYTLVNPDLSIQHKYYSFTGGKKPYLLNEINNNLGAITRIQYAPSTKFYLEDLQSGRPWTTRLHFPVQVVERTETIDYFSESKHVKTFKYHEGFYDPVEREFQGFGMVERWDAEPFDIFSVQSSSNSNHYVAPVYIKTWYHTGATFWKQETVSQQYQNQYFQGDDQAFDLPDTVFEGSFDNNDGETIRQAYHALHGSILREEIYGLDRDQNPTLVDNPYVVTESNMSIRMLQPKEGNEYAVFMITNRENLSYNYERNAADPRIKHSMVLAVDAYGHPLQTCQVFYPRRTDQNGDELADNIHPEQLQLKATLNITSFINSEDIYYRIGVVAEERSFELGGLSLGATGYFTFEALKIQVDQAVANRIAFEETLSGMELQARMLSWQRHFYWDNTQSDAMPLGQGTAKALLHHSETAVFSTVLLQDAFLDRIPEAWLEKGGKLETTGGYRLEETTELWWNPGLEYHYEGEDQFFLPSKMVDPFEQETNLTYDAENLVLIQIINALQNTISAVPDYYTLHPQQITDINDNISQTLFDPLGQVIATSIFGTEAGGQSKGDQDLNTYQILNPSDVQTILTDPDALLQNASSYFFYDLTGWQEHRKPLSSIGLEREIYNSDLAVGEDSPLQIKLTYTDGFGRVIESKVKAESGLAKLLDNNGNVLEQQSNDRWLTSGRTIYNNKGKAVKQYEPFFSHGSNYQGEIVLSQTGVSPIYHYDPLLRQIRVDTPKGFFSKSEFKPWYQIHSDVNDTVKEAAYFEQFDQLSNAEKAALNLAQKDYQTPNIHVFDNQGRAFLSYQILVDDSNTSHYLPTKIEFNIQGNGLSFVDPRLSKTNEESGTQFKNLRQTFDMNGDVLAKNSSDAGVDCHLYNVFGNQLWTWTARDYVQIIEYDALQRKKRVYIHKKEADVPVPPLEQFNLVEDFIFGEDQPNSKDNNLRGKIFQLKDLSGILSIPSYDLHGNVLSSSRQFIVDYKTPNDWQSSSLVDLESEVYQSQFSYDALGRLSSKTTPDNTITRHQYNPRGLLKAVDLKFSDGTAQSVIQNISYNARGQRESISYANGVNTQYQYEATTFRMVQLTSSRTPVDENGRSREPVLQNISYVYDPIGNITQQEDHSFKTVYHNNQVINARSTYEYDSLYRLKKATGRQHVGINANAFKNNQSNQFFKQSIFNFAASDANKLENYTEIYTYDEAGNMTKKRHIANSASWTSDYEIAEDSNRLRNLNYDASGNLRQLQINSAIDLSYNCCEKLVKASIIQRPGELDDSDYYNYDSDEIRTRKVSERMAQNGSLIMIEEKIYLGNYEIKRQKSVSPTGQMNTTLERQTLRVMDGQNCALIIHYWTQDRLQTEVNNENTRKFHWQLDNHLGSVAMELDSDARLISYEEYFPYGGSAMIAGHSQREVQLKSYRYSGRERDDSTGLYYYGARYYLPWMGRWLEPDPAGTVDGLNLYAFVGDNPINFLDPHGLYKRAASDTHYDDTTVHPTPKAVRSHKHTGNYYTGWELREGTLANVRDVHTAIKNDFNLDLSRTISAPQGIKNIYQRLNAGGDLIYTRDHKGRTEFTAGWLDLRWGQGVSRAKPNNPKGGLSTVIDDRGHDVTQAFTTNKVVADSEPNIKAENALINQHYKRGLEEAINEYMKNNPHDQISIITQRDYTTNESKYTDNLLITMHYTTPFGNLVKYEYSPIFRPKRQHVYVFINGTPRAHFTFKNSKHIQYRHGRKNGTFHMG